MLHYKYVKTTVPVQSCYQENNYDRYTLINTRNGQHCMNLCKKKVYNFERKGNEKSLKFVGGTISLNDIPNTH